MGKICTFCKHKRAENRCALIFSNASVEYTERCCYYEPVEEVLPVVHAHWIINPKYSIVCNCSNCGVAVRGGFGENYCFNCGAKMDEEKE